MESWNSFQSERLYNEFSLHAFILHCWAKFVLLFQSDCGTGGCLSFGCGTGNCRIVLMWSPEPVVNLSYVDFEISGRTMGWVAFALSHDQLMARTVSGKIYYKLQNVIMIHQDSCRLKLTVDGAHLRIILLRLYMYRRYLWRYQIN